MGVKDHRVYVWRACTRSRIHGGHPRSARANPVQCSPGDREGLPKVGYKHLHAASRRSSLLVLVTPPRPRLYSLCSSSTLEWWRALRLQLLPSHLFLHLIAGVWARPKHISHRIPRSRSSDRQRTAKSLSCIIGFIFGRTRKSTSLSHLPITTFNRSTALMRTDFFSDHDGRGRSSLGTLLSIHDGRRRNRVVMSSKVRYSPLSG